MTEFLAAGEPVDHDDHVGTWTILRKVYAAAQITPGEPIARLDVDYMRSTEARGPRGSGLGRYFAAGSVGMQGMPGRIRAAISSRVAIDLDMANAHLVILAAICVARGIEIPYLRRVVDQREEVLREIQAEDQTGATDRTTAKVRVLTVLNVGAQARAAKSKWLSAFNAEITRVADALCLMPEVSVFLREKSGQKRFATPARRAMIAYVGHVESVCLHAATQYLEAQGFRTMTWQFDGLFVERVDETTERRLLKVLPAMSRWIATLAACQHVDLRWEVKPPNCELLDILDDLPLDPVPVDDALAVTVETFTEHFAPVIATCEGVICDDLIDAMAGWYIRGPTPLLSFELGNTTDVWVIGSNGLLQQRSAGTCGPILIRTFIRDLRTAAFAAFGVSAQAKEFLVMANVLNRSAVDRVAQQIGQSIVAWGADEKYARSEPLDQAIGLFAFSDGTVIDSTGPMPIVRRARGADLLSQTTGYPFDPARRPCIETRVRRIIWSIFESEEHVGFILSLISNMFYGRNTNECAVFMLGESGANGKGVLATMLKIVGGERARTGVNRSLFTSPPPDGHDSKLANLRIARAVVVEEGSVDAVYQVDRFKMLTNNGAISASAKGKNEAEWWIQFVPVILSNHRPNFGAQIESAVMRRVIPVVFPFEFRDGSAFDERDPTHRHADPQLKDWLTDRATVGEVRTALIHLALDHARQSGRVLFQPLESMRDTCGLARFLTGESTDYAAVCLDRIRLLDAATTPKSEWMSPKQIATVLFPKLDAASVGRVLRVAMPLAIPSRTSAGMVYPVRIPAQSPLDDVGFGV